MPFVLLGLGVALAALLLVIAAYLLVKRWL